MSAYVLSWLVVLIGPAPDDEALKPPVQGPLRFAVAKASQTGDSIAVKFQGGGRQQSYTVMVPVKVTIKDGDGNEQVVTRMRPETRTRTAFTYVTEAYQVEVPVTVPEKQPDGTVKEVKKTQTVTRTRKVPVTKASQSALHKISECRFVDLAGKPVDRKEVARRLKTWSPIVLAYKDMKLDPFYKAALNPQILLVQIPAPKRRPQPRPPRPVPKLGQRIPEPAPSAPERDEPKPQ